MRPVKGRLSEADRLRASYWHNVVVAGGCVMCKHFPPEVHLSRQPDVRTIRAHHVLPKARLMREGKHEHLWDERNGMALCEYHHTRHHGYAQRVPRDLVRDETFGFAAELDLEWLIDREYPPERR